MTASRIPGLDALRGLAALLVLGYHARTVAPLSAIWPTAVLGHGYLAVDLFFVISGFVLARAYDDRLAAGGGGAFMIRRLKRLYPLALLGLLLGAAMWLGQGEDPVSVALLLGLGLIFAPFTGGRDVFPLNGPQWSLMWELLANLAYALVAPWLTRRRLVGLVVVAGVAHAVLVLSHGTGSLGPYAQDGWAGAPRVAFGFFAGVMLARERFKIPAAPIAGLLALVVLILSPPVPEQARGVFDLVAALATFPLVVASAARSEVGALRPLLDRLAGLSYALYALHIPIVLGLARWGLGALAMPAALAAAWAAHRWFEPWAAGVLARKPQGFSTSLPSSSAR